MLLLRRTCLAGAVWGRGGVQMGNKTAWRGREWGNLLGAEAACSWDFSFSVLHCAFAQLHTTKMSKAGNSSYLGTVIISTSQTGKLINTQRATCLSQDAQRAPGSAKTQHSLWNVVHGWLTKPSPAGLGLKGNNSPSPHLAPSFPKSQRHGGVTLSQ